MSSPNPYGPQGQYPGQGQYRQGQYNPQAQPARSYDDELVSIPMKKTNPMVALAIAGGAALVLGVAAFSFFGGKKQTVAPSPSALAAVETRAEEEAKAKAIREHLEITQRSLAKLKEDEAAKAKAAAPEPTQAAAAPEPTQAAAAPEPAQAAVHTVQRTSRAAPVAPARHVAIAATPAPAPAPKPVSNTGSKKKMDSLDELGKGIASELGK